MSNFHFDPYSPAVDADPFPYYKRLRDDFPCFWSNEAQMWILSRYADIVSAGQDWQTYSSAKGNLMTELPGRAEPPALDAPDCRQDTSVVAKDDADFRSKILAVFSNTPPVRTLVATTATSLPWNQTLGLGGWKTPEGKRAIVLATVHRGDDAQQVRISSKVIEYTETGGIELGLSGFNNDDQKPNGTLTLDSKQVADWLNRTQSSKEVSLS